ncbi:hypothetical protein EMCRGX_G008896, partial [Ephydatia muelleri]
MVEPMDMGHSADSSELIPQIQTVRMSLRPPSRFTGGTDLILWLKRFEMYVRKVKVDESQWTSELLPLLDDGPFRVVSQQGLVDSGDYAAVTRCLRAQYAPEGNHLEWQAKFQRRGQKADENLVTYVGELRVLADKAYPGWSNDQRLQLVRDQFVQGLRSSTVQLRLMKEMPETLDEALKLAIQQESVEAAQKRLSSERGHGSSSFASSSIEDAAAENGIATMSVQQLRKQARDSERIVQDLRKQIQELNGRLSGKEKPTVADQPPQSSAFSRQQGSAAITCWNCREQGHIRRNCPHKRSGRKKAPWQISAVSQNAGRCTSNSSALLVEPVWRFMDQHGLMVAHSIIDAAATHTMVQVLNPGFAPVTVYKDEIMVETHVKQLKEVLERLKIAGLKIRPKKCHLLQTSVQYLGHVISAEGIRTDPQKVACVSNWPVPRNSKELQSFLGLASYYRRFVKDFAHIASPLHALTEKGREWVWSKECNDAFFDLKKRLVSSPILTLPDFSLPFVLDTDASGDGLGAVLAQNVDGVERVVAYASRALSRTEKKYCATRREMLALVWAARHFRPYLYGRKFTLRTDHHCLQWLHNFKEPEGQVARWLEVLSEYDYTVIHRVGKQHTNADALSRGRCVQCGLEKKEEEREEANSCDAVSHLMLPTWTEEEIKSFQSADPDIHQMVYWLETDATPTGCPKDASWRLASLWVQRRYL